MIMEKQWMNNLLRILDSRFVNQTIGRLPNARLWTAPSRRYSWLTKYKYIYIYTLFALYTMIPPAA